MLILLLKKCNYICPPNLKRVFNLIIDIGNTSSKVAFAQGITLGKTHRFSEELKEEDINSLIEHEKPESVILSSVKEVNPSLLSYLENISSKLLILNDKTKIPIKNRYGTPETLGTDRLASAVAANTLFPDKELIIFDFGTAMTVDFVNREGEFLGGNISLGLRMRFNAINHYTNKLPLLSTPSCVENIGSYTVGAVESGIILGIMFEIEGYISKYANHTVIFTGGDAKYFAEKMKSPIFVVHNLVLMGLARIAEFNAAD